MNRFYAGIGSRKTPKEILSVMTTLASMLEDLGMILRSGGAKGADLAFEKGVKDSDNKEIFYSHHANLESIKIASKYHSAWDFLPEYARKLHARNVFQILGKDLQTPSSIVICWTPDGAEKSEQTSKKTGGTGQAIRVADAYNIPIINLHHWNSLDRINNWITDNIKSNK